MINLSGNPSGHQYFYYQYWLYAVFIALGIVSFGCGCTFQVIDKSFFTNAHFTSYQESMCHQMLGEEADRRYGEHRMWASIGWGLMAAVSGRKL